jgi:probable HAF family extracellular repeat protein
MSITSMLRRSAAAALLSAAATGSMPGTAQAAEPAYTATEVTAPGIRAPWPKAMNDSGRLAGRTRGNEFYPPASQSFVSLATGESLHFSPFGATQSEALAINAHADTAGYFVANWQHRSYIRRAGGEVIDLFAGKAAIASEARGINVAGTVVGFYDIDRTELPFVWRGGKPRTLGDLGGHYGGAFAVNDAGVIVGYSRDTSFNAHAVVFEGDTVQDLGVFPGLDNWSSANAINAAGTIVGICTDPVMTWHPCLWVDRGAPTVLAGFEGALPGGEAYAVNAGGDIVGRTRAANGEYHAVLWRDGQPWDLNVASTGLPADMVLKSASAINDGGMILVDGHSDGAGIRHYVLRPVAPR